MTGEQQKDQQEPIHTGDDDLLDLLTGIRSAIEELRDETDADQRVETLEAALEDLDKADALRVAELKSEPHEERWQPIESAPKDRQVIVYEPGGTYANGISYPACVGIAHWWRGDDLNEPGWNGPYNPRGYPTHWQPLPAPPSERTGK